MRQRYQRNLSGRDNETEIRQRAEGVLVALRRCTVEVAAGEIIRASHRHRLDSGRVACTLLRLAQGIEPEADSNATAVARYEWGALLLNRN